MCLLTSQILGLLRDPWGGRWSQGRCGTGHLASNIRVLLPCDLVPLELAEGKHVPF